LALRNHQADPSAVRQVACCGVAEFMAAFWHPPHPLVGRVTSMIQLGERSGIAEARKVFQSDLLRGEKIFVPGGQLFLSFER